LKRLFDNQKKQRETISDHKEELSSPR